ncbi:MAG: BamA/TamA family outer membrane protein [Thermoanaerobaculia bacterium]
MNRLFVAGLVLAGALLPLRPAAGQASAAPQWRGEGFGKNKIQYREFDWKIYRSPHFNVHYYSSEEVSLQKVVSLAESAYDQLARGFNFQIKDPIPLIYYATHSAFEQNNIIMNFIPEGVGAFASPTRFRMVLPIDMPDSELMELILHELTHIFEYHMLFQGSLAKAVATTPPTWFMEGLASYMAKDETARDKMFLRDAVVNDNIPPISRSDFGGFFAYRFGHAVFDFIEERWGRDGFLDFLYEIRNTVGGRPERAVERAFKLEPEEFDLEFRRWLRKKYLPELVETGEPGDFGRLFRIENQSVTRETSPATSPSGDLVAAVSASKGDVDVVLFDAEKRVFLRNLTKGYTNDYQYLIAQEMQIGRQMGRDISFSPDGNTIAVFAKREKGRSLLLLDVLNGGIRQTIDMPDIEQQLAPAWSPDGRTIAFSGWRNGRFDIFTIDVESRAIANFTDDEIFDGAPVYSPDGRSIVLVSVVGDGYAKLFRIDLDKPGQRYQLTGGESNENDPVYSPDGKRIYFTSDRDGRDNIYSLDLATGELRQHTNVVTGASQPTVVPEPESSEHGDERLVFTGFWKQTFNLYVTDVEEPVKEPTKEAVPVEPTLAQDIPRFEPDIQVTLDDANKDKYGGFKFFLEDAQAYAGVDDNQTYVGRILLIFSDNLGDKRILADISSVESFSNYDVIYADFSRRIQWQAHLFDQRLYYLEPNFRRGQFERAGKAVQFTGAIGSLIYPFTFYTRAEIGAGYMLRQFNAPVFEQLETGEQVLVDFVPVKDDGPILQGALVGDSAGFANWGPITGRRWRLDASYSPDLDGSGTLFSSADIDFRQYFAVTRRSNLAFRAFAGINEGNLPSPIFIGGMDTLRGGRFRDILGDRAFFANVEYRFPLVDLVATPVLNFQGIRGVFFFDVGGAWFGGVQDFEFYNSDENRLEDGIAAYGYGITVQFLGIDLNWDFARRTDLKDAQDYRTTFWIGTRF